MKNVFLQLEKNPYDYDSHVDLIGTLRKCGELEQLRSARQAMASAFPLSPTLWEEWIEDEKEISTPETIKDLFERAVKDYLSLDLWIEYCQWSISLGDFQFSRQIFERALSECGFHVRTGTVLWDAFRVFESSVQDFQKQDSSVTAEEKSIQNDRISDLFRRQLCISLAGMEDTWTEYIDFLGGESPSPGLLSDYKSALQELKNLLPFEDALDAADSPKYREYMAYLDQERKEKHKNPGRIKVLFERAITENCLDDYFWIEYLSWLDRYNRVHEIILPVYERAVRNCHWSPNIWQRYLLALERAGKSWTDIESVFSRATSYGLNDSSEGVNLWLNYIYMVQRREAKASEEAKSPLTYDAIADAFRRGKESLIQAFGSRDWDSECYFRKSWANFEAYRRNNMEFSRKLWTEEILPSGHKALAASWLEFFELERRFGGKNHVISSCRKLLGSAVTAVSDFPEAICHSFLQFEREEGTLADLDAAMIKVETRMKAITSQKKARKTRFEGQRGGRDLDRPPQRNERPTQNKPTSSFHTRDQSSVKRKAEQGDPEQSRTPPEKKSKKDSEGFAVPASVPQPLQKKKSPEAKKVEDLSGSPPGKKKHSVDTSKYDRTLFIANIPLDTDEERIRSIFSPFGEITDVRLLKKAANSRSQYGFLEYKSSTSVASALKLDRTVVEGRPMFVSQCEDKAKNPTQFRYGVGLDKKKLFVKGIPAGVKDADLDSIFGPLGKLKQVHRLSSNRVRSLNEIRKTKKKHLIMS